VIPNLDIVSALPLPHSSPLLFPLFFFILFIPPLLSRLPFPTHPEPYESDRLVRPLSYRGKFVFIAQIGSSQKAIYELGVGGVDPSGVGLDVFVRQRSIIVTVNDDRLTLDQIQFTKFTSDIIIVEADLLRYI